MASGTRWTSDDAIRAQERIARNKIDVVQKVQGPIINANPFITTVGFLSNNTPNQRSITLTLFGIPMPKQSVRQGRNKHTGGVIFFQPTEMLHRIKDYQDQIKKQLPEGFTMFEKEVRIVKMHFVFPPLKEFSKNKGKMERLHNGELFNKTTKPDLDNLSKIVFDCMNEVIYKDDSLIYSIDGVRKYYGTGGMIVLTLEGI